MMWWHSREPSVLEFAPQAYRQHLDRGLPSPHHREMRTRSLKGKRWYISTVFPSNLLLWKSEHTLPLQGLWLQRMWKIWTLLFLSNVDRILGTERKDKHAQIALSSYLESGFNINWFPEMLTGLEISISTVSNLKVNWNNSNKCIVLFKTIEKSLVPVG